MCALRCGPHVTLSFRIMLVIFEGKKCIAAYGTKNLLVDDCLCKLQYDNYLHLHYDIPVGETIE